jgi:hypothetical protein
MHSGAGEHDEPLDPDVVVVGAGGVALGPLPPTPSGSAGVLSAMRQPPPHPPVDATACHHVPQQQVSSYSSEGDVDVSDADSDSFFARNSEEAARGAFSRAHAQIHPHPHAHAGYRVGHDDDDDDVDGGWGIAKDAPLYGPPNMEVDVEEEECEFEEEEEEDEDEEDEEGSDGPAIEVRRRRPSWVVHHDEHEHLGDDEDDEDDGPPLSPPPPPRIESDSDEP